MTKPNRPRVKIVTGSDIKATIGFINKFTRASKPATIIAVQKFLISTPAKSFEVIKTAILFNSQAQIIILIFS